LSSAHLEHLNEGDTKIEVGKITTDQRHGEHESDGHNGAQIDSASHWDLLSRVEGCREAGHDLGHEGRESQVPCCENDWVVEVCGIKDPFVEDDDTGTEGDPCAFEKSQTARSMRLQRPVYSRNVDCWGDTTLCRFRLVQ